jgi:NhaA family Na+:H+ antiporter
MGAALIGGVGFTVSLFITDLAFTDRTLEGEAKVGGLAASLTAASTGYLLLRLVDRRK